MQWIEITIHTNTNGADAMADVFFSLGIAGVSIEDAADIALYQRESNDWDYIDESIFANRGGDVRVKAYIQDEPHAPAILEAVRQKAAAVASTPGFDAGHHEDKMGFRNVHTCSLFFDDMRLPDKYRLGEEGEGFSIAMRILNVSRPANSANCVGLAQAALDEAVAYSKQRVVGGQPICKKGVIAAMLADMEMQVQSARQMVWAVCRAANAGIFDKKLTAVAKCFCSDAAMKVTTDAVQIFGGNGYSKEYPVEKLMRDAKIFQIFEGTNQIQRDIIGRQLVK